MAIISDSFFKLPADKLIALTAYGEARGESATGMMAVINVIRNRTKNLHQFADKGILSSYGKYHAVILKPKQFSVFNPSNLMYPKLKAIATTFDSYLKADANLNKAYDLAKMAVHGILADNTNGATHYHTMTSKPYWSKVLAQIGRIGNHVFYRSASITGLENMNPLLLYTILTISGLGVYYMSKKGKI